MGRSDGTGHSIEHVSDFGKLFAEFFSDYVRLILISDDMRGNQYDEFGPGSCVGRASKENPQPGDAAQQGDPALNPFLALANESSDRDGLAILNNDRGTHQGGPDDRRHQTGCRDGRRLADLLADLKIDIAAFADLRRDDHDHACRTKLNRLCEEIGSVRLHRGN